MLLQSLNMKFLLYILKEERRRSLLPWNNLRSGKDRSKSKEREKNKDKEVPSVSG